MDHFIEQAVAALEQRIIQVRFFGYEFFLQRPIDNAVQGLHRVKSCGFRLQHDLSIVGEFGLPAIQLVRAGNTRTESDLGPLEVRLG